MSPARVEEAIWAKEALLGRPLTMGQTDAVIGLCTSGRGVEVVIGVAGAGKTTMLDVARAGFEAAGYRVIGTATSGQAARTLGREAHLSESRTVASLLWRLDHERVTLDERTVLIVDEAAMTDDPALLRLLTAAETAGAKTILVGDHRQLGAIGPSGAIEGLAQRFPDAVHVLRENVRQADRDERSVLAHLRAGDVSRAVDWYVAHDRVRIGGTRSDGPGADGRRLVRRRAGGRAIGHVRLAAGQRRRAEPTGPRALDRRRSRLRTGDRGARRSPLRRRRLHRHARAGT